jgi:ribosomal protein S18 acetylase RimI-like enzyme
MYGFIIPVLRELQISKLLLEVITENKPAILSYQKTGFETKRKLSCFKGGLKLFDILKSDYEIRSLENYDWEKLQSFWDWKPTWPNSIMVVENLKQSNTSFGIFRENVLSGYIIYNSKTKRMQQFGIDKNHRKKYLAKQLFNHIAKHFELILPLSISRLMQPVQLN